MSPDDLVDDPRLSRHFVPADQATLRRLLAEQARRLSQPKKGYLRYRELYDSVAHLSARHLDTGSDVVEIGRRAELSDDDFEKVEHAMRGFMPWRKGPFRVFGLDIDAEWRSERKWQRLQPALPELAGKVIADIGSNNGYYMFRMAHHHPLLVLGFEPYIHHWFTFRTLNRFAGLTNLRTELLGVEHISLFSGVFDVVFLMGVLYHRRSPLEVLQEVRGALKPGGTLIIESQGIPGQEPLALFPEKTYAKVPGTYFVPTAACLANWLERSGFQEVEFFLSHAMSSEEQRRTDWMNFESYADFIDPADPTRTVEGYPAPLRLFFKALAP